MPLVSAFDGSAVIPASAPSVSKSTFITMEDSASM
jgi:hypothetical protein